MHYADDIGLDHVLGRMQAYHSTHGDDFKPAALLERLVAEHKSFKTA